MRARFLLAAALLLGAAPASANTYTYEGGFLPHTLGNQITGTAEFSFDTSSFTGTVWPNQFSASLSVGTHTASIFPSSRFHFEAGLITSWYVTGITPCGGTSSCFITTGLDQGGIGPVPPYDQIAHQCAFTCQPFNPLGPPFLGQATGPIGSWTMVVPSAVPGPVVGTGLPALMTLLAWWLRSRRR